MSESALFSRTTLNEAADDFLNDIAEVSGYGTSRHGLIRDISPYVMRRPILTIPDPWFYAGLVALEATKICDLFQPKEAAVLLRRVSTEVDAAVGRSGRALSRLIFALMGRLGCGAVLLRMKVSDDRISDMILLMMGNEKTWQHLLPDAEAHHQVRRALRTGPPSWWIDYFVSRNPKPAPLPVEEEAVDLNAVPAVPALVRMREHLAEISSSN